MGVLGGQGEKEAAESYPGCGQDGPGQLTHCFIECSWVSNHITSGGPGDI